MYKTFHINKPTICFWPNEFSHIRDNALSYYKEMKKMVFLDNPKNYLKRLNTLMGKNNIFKCGFQKKIKILYMISITDIIKNT